MDPLTKKLMAASGLRPGNPTLPPVQGVRMVYLKEEMTDAENDLHEARNALESVRAGGPKKPLYIAMAKLEGKEQDYFARRYFGRDKIVLKGWNNGWKQNIFTDKINALLSDAKYRARKAFTLHKSAKDAAGQSVVAFGDLRKMDNACYNRHYGRRTRVKNTPNFANSLQKINKATDDIRRHLGIARGLPDGTPDKDASIASIRESLRDAETCQRLANLVVQNRWDLPMDLR